MSTVQIIHTLEELKDFLDKNGVLEIAVRNQNKKFKSFQKIVIDTMQKGQTKDLAEKVLRTFNSKKLLNTKNLKILSNVANLEKLGLLLNGLNLCATCAGFAIMYAKLDKLSSEITQQINQVRKDIKDVNDLHTDFEFNNVLSEHTDMLDCEKKQKPYSEEKLRSLVDAEYNILMLMIGTLQKDVTGDREALIFSVFSMLAMFTVSLRKFDETYYFNNQASLGQQDPWHLSHSKWMSVYEKLSSPWCVEKLQDFGTFDKDMDTAQVDAYYCTLMEQVKDLREEVEDNQALILAFKNMDTLHEYRQLSTKEVTDILEAAFSDAGTELHEPAAAVMFEAVLKQTAMA